MGRKYVDARAGLREIFGKLAEFEAIFMLRIMLMRILLSKTFSPRLDFSPSGKCERLKALTGCLIIMLLMRDIDHESS